MPDIAVLRPNTTQINSSNPIKRRKVSSERSKDSKLQERLSKIGSEWQKRNFSSSTTPTTKGISHASNFLGGLQGNMLRGHNLRAGDYYQDQLNNNNQDYFNNPNNPMNNMMNMQMQQVPQLSPEQEGLVNKSNALVVKTLVRDIFSSGNKIDHADPKIAAKLAEIAPLINDSETQPLRRQLQDIRSGMPITGYGGRTWNDLHDNERAGFVNNLIAHPMTHSEGLLQQTTLQSMQHQFKTVQSMILNQDSQQNQMQIQEMFQMNKQWTQMMQSAV